MACCLLESASKFQRVPSRPPLTLPSSSLSLLRPSPRPLVLLSARAACAVLRDALGMVGEAVAVCAELQRELVAVIRFSASNWRSPAGSTSVAGVSGYQAQAMASTRPYAPFNIDNLCSPSLTPSYPNGYLLGVVQAQGAWTPTGVVNRFDFALDISHD